MQTETLLVAFVVVFTLALFTNTGMCLKKTDVAAIWALEEGKGEEITDSVNGVKGTFNGAPEWVEGKYGSGLEFHGSADWIVTEALDIFVCKEEGITIGLWFKTEDLPAEGESAFITKGYADTTQLLPWYQLMYTDGSFPVVKGTTAMEVRKAAGDQGYAMGQTEVNDGEWHHIAGVIEGVEVRTYVDGNLDATAACAEANYGENEDPLIFMRQYNVGIIGATDEFFVINKVLNEDELKQLMKGADSALGVESVGKLSTTWGELKSVH